MILCKGTLKILENGTSSKVRAKCVFLLVSQVFWRLMKLLNKWQWPIDEKASLLKWQVEEMAS
jgi:hypothetical protein